MAAQIGHAGPVTNGRSNGLQALSASPMPSPLSMQLVRAATQADLSRVVRQYVDGARLAVRAGFDSLELHLGHNYLLSAFLAPNLNRRTDTYGGSLENQARLPRQVVDAVQLSAGSSLNNPMYLFRGDVPLKEFARQMPFLVSLGVRVSGNRFLPVLPVRGGR